MSLKYLALGLALVNFALTVSAQSRIDEHGVLQPSVEAVAPNRRLGELLRKPTFITLRLLSIPRDISREKPSDTPPPYTVGDWVGFELFITQSLSQTITISE